MPITDHRESEIAELKEKVAKLEKALIDSQSLCAVGELAGTTAHEFNNILTLTINYARMGLRHSNAETRDEMFDKILEASNRAAKIVKVVLGLARNRKPGKEPTNLEELVDAVLLLLETIGEKSGQKQKLLTGTIVVKLRRCEDDPNYVEVVVRDHGTGIPKDKLPHIFDMFYSTKKGPDATGKGGSGLGLSTCKRIVEDHAGKIRVESAIGKGTAFTIRLPIVPKEEEI